MADLRGDDPNSDQRLLQRVNGAPSHDWKHDGTSLSLRVWMSQESDVCKKRRSPLSCCSWHVCKSLLCHACMC